MVYGFRSCKSTKKPKFYSKEKDKLNNNDHISDVVYQLDTLVLETIYFGETIQKE